MLSLLHKRRAHTWLGNVCLEKLVTDLPSSLFPNEHSESIGPLPMAVQFVPCTEMPGWRRPILYSESCAQTSPPRENCIFTSLLSQGISPSSRGIPVSSQKGLFLCLLKGPEDARALKGSLRRHIKDTFRTKSEATGKLEKWSLRHQMIRTFC